MQAWGQSPSLLLSSHQLDRGVFIPSASSPSLPLPLERLGSSHHLETKSSGWPFPIQQCVQKERLFQCSVKKKRRDEDGMLHAPASRVGEEWELVETCFGPRRLGLIVCSTSLSSITITSTTRTHSTLGATGPWVETMCERGHQCSASGLLTVRLRVWWRAVESSGGQTIEGCTGDCYVSRKAGRLAAVMLKPAIALLLGQQRRQASSCHNRRLCEIFSLCCCGEPLCSRESSQAFASSQPPLLVLAVQPRLHFVCP